MGREVEERQPPARICLSFVSHLKCKRLVIILGWGFPLQLEVSGRSLECTVSCWQRSKTHHILFMLSCLQKHLCAYLLSRSLSLGQWQTRAGFPVAMTCRKNLFSFYFITGMNSHDLLLSHSLTLHHPGKWHEMSCVRRWKEKLFIFSNFLKINLWHFHCFSV